MSNAGHFCHSNFCLITDVIWRLKQAWYVYNKGYRWRQSCHLWTEQNVFVFFLLYVTYKITFWKDSVPWNLIHFVCLYQGADLNRKHDVSIDFLFMSVLYANTWFSSYRLLKFGTIYSAAVIQSSISCTSICWGK